MKINSVLTSTCLVSFIIFASCSSMSKEDKIALAANIAQTATSVGVSVDLLANPQHRIAYIGAQQALNLILKSDNFDAKALQEALANLPIKELKGTQGALIISGAISVFQLSTSRLFDISSNQAAKKIGTAILDGLDLALASSTTKSLKKAKSGPSVDYKVITVNRIKI